MIIKVVKLRSDCTISKFETHLNRFIDKVYHKARFIMVEVKLVTKTGAEITLGDGYYMDLNNDGELKSHKYYLSQFYSDHFEVNEIINIVFTHVKCTKKIYLAHLSKIRDEKS